MFCRKEKPTNNPPFQYHPQTLPLIANNRRAPQREMPPNQTMIEQKQFLEQRSNQNDAMIKGESQQKTDTDPMYCNTMQSQSDSLYSDSVKYYVPENLTEK